jgi:hypothetical protein
MIMILRNTARYSYTPRRNASQPFTIRELYTTLLYIFVSYIPLYYIILPDSLLYISSWFFKCIHERTRTMIVTIYKKNLKLDAKFISKDSF